jgi:hypothetical protein
MKRILLIPPRITLLIHRNQGRLLKLTLLVLVFITAMYTKEYRGEYQQLITAHIGGILYVLFGSLLFSLVWPSLKSWQAASLALGCTSLLEVIQYFRFPFLVDLTRSRVFLYLLGNSYNPMDFVYYFIGGVIGLGVLLLIVKFD